MFTIQQELLRRLGISTLGAIASTVLFAQTTSSGMSGIITDERGDPLFGATVMVTHLPSGTVYGGVTNTDGRYNIQGMRPGGPYQLVISYVGFKTFEQDQFLLTLGNIHTEDVKLVSGQELEEVVITAQHSFQNKRDGAASNFSRTQMESTPTVSRSISDVIKQTPQVMVRNGNISVAGASSRYNSFQIDGIVSNDVFGVTSTGTHGGDTGTNPISLDALEQIQVVIAPYDIRQSGFTGGGINAITKSGTNHFQGSAYTYFNNQSLIGKTPGKDVAERTRLNEQQTQTFGLSLGGPLLKDKLFYFINAEGFSESLASPFFPGYQSDYVTAAQAQQIQNRYQELTGITEDYAARNLDKKSFDMLARVDWNINQAHKLSVRFQSKNARAHYPHYSSAWSYYFNNSIFEYINDTKSVVGELQSHLSDHLSNELRLGYTRVRDTRDVPYEMPYVSIDNVGERNVRVVIGTDRYSAYNDIFQDVYTLTDNLSWFKGNHAIVFGMHHEFYNLSSAFLEAPYGAYAYSSIDAFLKDEAYRYQYNYFNTEVTGTDQWRSHFKAMQLGFYAQDDWRMHDRFNLTYGLRVDMPVILTNPTENPTFNTSALAEGGKYQVGRSPKMSPLFSPRLGFRYFLDEEQKTLLRGGTGIFTGRIPFVWISNSFANTGMEASSLTFEGETVPQFTTTPQVNEEMKGALAINTVSEDFKFPQAFRSSLALEHTTPSGYRFTLEGLYSKGINQVYFSNIVYQDQGRRVFLVEERASSSSTIPLFQNMDKRYSDVVNLGNTQQGYQYDLSLEVGKSFDFGLDLSASYNFGHSYSVSDIINSIAYYAWSETIAEQTNDPDALSYSSYDVPHRVNVNLSYQSPRYGMQRFATRVGLNYQGYSGGRFSYIYNETMELNGDLVRGNTLLYIPTEEELDQMSWSDEDSKAAFNNWIESNDYARDHRGEFTERNGGQAPFQHMINLHVAQSFYFTRASARRLELSLDLLNVGNLLHSDWGASYMNTPSIAILRVDELQQTDQGVTPTYSWNGNQPLSLHDMASRWRIQLGAKVVF